MMDFRAPEIRTNKKFIKDNSKSLKKYAINCKKKFGDGIIVINSTLVQNRLLTDEDFIIPSFKQDNQSTGEENTWVNPISYLVNNGFWFKMLRIKIKKKYHIDIKTDYDLGQYFLLVFIKDSALESVSIYSIKIR